LTELSECATVNHCGVILEGRMRIGTVGVALVASLLAVAAMAVTPASAEFFGCNDKPGRVLYSYAGAPDAYASVQSRQYSHELAAQTRPRIVIHPRRGYPGRSARRLCESWLVKEYRVSGPVVVPRMRCHWE
jgi:hypothetical protein